MFNKSTHPPIRTSAEQWQAIDHAVREVTAYLDAEDFTADIATLNAQADWIIDIALPTTQAAISLGNNIYDQLVDSLSLTALRACFGDWT